MVKSKQHFFSMSRSDIICIPILIGTPLFAYCYPNLVFLVIILYLIAGCLTGYYWPCVLTPLGAFLAAMFQSPMNDAIESITCFSSCAVLGLMFGIVLQEYFQREPQNNAIKENV
jgi:hypothetical protein